MTSFFSLLRYSYGNEDWKTEEIALNIQPEDKVLCITASGDRPLNLLARECKSIVCIDANQVQNFLLQLKIIAMENLEYEEYLSFLGATPSNKRKETLRYLLTKMDPNAASFWRKNEKMVIKGILYQGSVERLTFYAAKALSLARGKKVERLFTIHDLEEQKQFVRQEWDSYFWRQFFNVCLNPIFSRFIIKDPGLANIGTNINPGKYIYERIHSSLDRELANKNPLLSLLMRGYVTSEAYSPYLTREGTQVIKKRLSSLEIQTRDIIDYLDSLPGPTFDVFSLSDVVSYLNYPDFIRLLKNLIRTAKPGARFCLRQFLSSYEIPTNLQPFFKRDHALEKKLEEEDNCFVYRFSVGSIVTPEHTQVQKKINKPKVFVETQQEELCQAN